MAEDQVTHFAFTDFRGKQTKFGIKSEDRTKHVYVIGKTGMGKSTLLENMAIQDIRNGNALAFIDPHGKTAELLLDYIPEERIDDVLYIAPFDMEYPIAFNVMEDVGADKRHLVANGLMSAFKKIWVDVWSARMEYILNNTMLALLEYPDSTIIGVNRMLADKAYRKRVVANVTDVSVKAFWEDEFAKYNERFMVEAGAAIQNKVGQFVSNPLVRNIIGQPKSSFDLREMMDDKKIIIINLSKGLVGEANANLLGSMLITKIYLAAMSRADVTQTELSKLPEFYLYVDEFQSFANESFADILSEARKYKLNLTIAHQYIEQMSEEVREAVFGNVGTFITFRVGAYDAEVLEKEFAPEFSAEDLVNLGRFQAYLKLMINSVGSRPFSASSMPPMEAPEISYKDKIIKHSREKYGKPRAVVEEAIIRWHETGSYDVGAQPLGGGNQPGQSQSQQNQSRQGQNQQNFGKNSKRETQTPETLKRNMDKVSEREKKLRRAVSLEHLKPKREKKKRAPSKENVNDLRKALSTVLKDVHSRHPEIKKSVEEKPERFEEKQKSQEENPPIPNYSNKANAGEVPEDVLRKVLDVKDS